jgi:hypothetical protein
MVVVAQGIGFAATVDIGVVTSPSRERSALHLRRAASQAAHGDPATNWAGVVITVS